ncbi:uncharacterized protein METZ01_LOCUS164925 [marine metagenome]|uniref:Uncharacterized protein n=1 Tax=marine metagenome TaxID=408172 RepID=A0A382BEZ6_9ZZZZ
MYSDPNAPTKQLPHLLGYYGVKTKPD